MAGRRRKQAPLPTREKILEYIRESPTPVGKREIARAFAIKGADRIGLKAILKDLEREGFKSLCGEKKTQERIQYTLKTGKTLRN